MILLDTSGLLAALDADEPRHRAAAAVLREDRGPRLLSPFVLAEIDGAPGQRASANGRRGRSSRVVARGAYRLAPFDAVDIAGALDIIDAHGDLNIGLADASIAVLSRRYGTLDILALDERHFRIVRGVGDRPFRLLPADARAS
ncbi:MAG: type II toxin-antitoxin system VapC family toxin [Candidatus Dormibacteraceae bacterium]